MANFIHYTNVNSLFKKKNEQVWKSRNQDKLASPTLTSNPVSLSPMKLRKRFSLRVLISAIVLMLLVVGGVSAMILSQMQQDVRQQASGCTYWNGEAAAEGSYDNRGGVRQQCVGGYWTRPDDGNLDPSQIIAEQNAGKAKLGCINWAGDEVSHGSYDNRGGKRQQCNNGLWDFPDDGNLDPSGMPQPERDMRGCINWAGDEVSHGSYDNRGGKRQQCLDGLWDTPDDKITDPNDVASLAIVGAMGGLSSDEIEYAEARAIYDQYCRENVDPSDAESCKSFGNILTQEEQMIRYSALEDQVGSNTEAVSNAIGGLDERTVDFNEARTVYREYCEGAKAQQTSSSACKSLKAELDEISALVAQAENARWTAMNDAATGNTEAVSNAIGGLDERTVDFNEARTVYREYCEGAKAQMTSGSACNSLKSELDEMEAQRTAAETAKWTALNDVVTGNTSQVTEALGGLEDRSVDLSEANTIYREYCEGAKAQQTSSSACKALNESIEEIENLRDQSTLANAEGLNAVVTTNTAGVNYAISALNSGIMTTDAAEDSYERYCTGINKSYTSGSACESLQLSITESGSNETLSQSASHAMLSWTTLNQRVLLNNDAVGFVTEGLNDGSIDIAIASANYQELCIGPRSSLTAGTSCDDLKKALDNALPDVGDDCIAYLCINGKLCSDSGQLTNVSCEPTGTVCEPNTCAPNNTWCGENGEYSTIACSGTGCDDGRVAEGRCNGVGQRCVNGTLYTNYSCQTEQPDINSLIAENVDTSCFQVCLDRGGSQQRCNEECEGFNPNLVNSSFGYQTLSQCVTAMEMGGLDGRCSQSSGGRFVFEAASEQIAAAEYKYCYWWSTSTSRCVENVYLNPEFDSCSDQSSGLGDSCNDVKPAGVQDNPEEIMTDGEVISSAFTNAWDYLTNTLPTMWTYENLEEDIDAHYETLASESCQCTGSFLGEGMVTLNLGESKKGAVDDCYQCQMSPAGGCDWVHRCGYAPVTEVNNSVDQGFVELQLDNPDHLFLTSSLTTDEQVVPLQITLDLLPDTLFNSEQITYLVGDEGTGGGQAVDNFNAVFVGSPGDASYTQNPDVEYGYAISINVHETLHLLDDEYLDEFVDVAAKDGLVFETEFSDMAVAGEEDFMLYSEYPTTPTEGFAITGAAYVLSPDQLRQERPELYEFYRDNVFDGVEYIEVRNPDCVTSHIEVLSEESIERKQQASNQCS